MRLDEEQLDAALTGVAGQHAGRNHPRIVDDDAVPRTEQIGQLAKPVIFERAARAVDQKEARAVALGGRRLGNGLERQLIIEILQLHDP